MKAVAALLTAALLPTLSHATEVAAGGIGPFDLGMSFADARAAAPNADWSETLSRYTNKPIALEGRDALRLRGLSFDVSLEPLAYEGYQLRIVHAVDGGQASRRRCAEALAMVAETLETQYGALGPIAPLSDREEGGTPLGFLTALWRAEDIERVTVGRASQAEVVKPEGTGTTMWLTGLRREGLSIVAGGRFLDHTSPMWPSTCVVTAQLLSLPPRPDFEWVDLASLPTTPPPSIPSRRRSFAGLTAPLPATASKVEIACNVSRQSGEVSKCRAAEGSDDVLAKAAERQGDDLTLSPSQLDPDNDIPLRLRASLLIDPADAKPFSLPAGVTPLKATEVSWTSKPTAEALTHLYPARATRLELAARLSMTCQIAADGGLICADLTVVTAPGQEATFDGIGERIAELFRAGPTLVDGRPAAGQWVRMSFAFNP